MYSIILIIVAAMLNALMDTLVHHFSVSIFSKLNPKFWNPNISWEYAKILFAYKFDAWHIAKSLMLFSLIGSIVTYTPITTYKLVDFILLGVVWNTVFNVFYNKILR